MPRLAEPDEIPPGMWPGTLDEAVTELHRQGRGGAA
jgi:hypothetical protein